MRKTATLSILSAAAVLAGCNTTPTQDGALLGGALGAATGAIVGHQSGHQGEGALIGAGLGAITGAIVGDQVEQNRRGAYPQNRHTQASQPTVHKQRGHYEHRIVTTPSGETYEERVWVPHN